eukprot:TRINITY_DN10857_c0_g1_i1.p1 TRINITY_DN10857_c0_g1~~TRINITY_DN10857_c0_g1_i1.p1  ORF type:complete len:439 (+),score=78.28 TRINITY_DN10857_c0_g1_i1:48-1364(+)
MGPRSAIVWISLITATSLLGFLVMWHLTNEYDNAIESNIAPPPIASRPALSQTPDTPPTKNTYQETKKNRLNEDNSDKDTVEKSLAEYVEFHRNAMKQKDISKLKFVVYVENLGGIGNHFLPMTSVLAYAMLTNRIYLQYRVSVSGVQLSSMFKSVFDVVELDDVAERLGTTSSRIMNNIDQCYNITIRHVFIQEHWEHIHCNQYAQDNHQFVRIFSNQYFMPALLHNPLYLDRVRKVFGDGFYRNEVDLHGPLSRALFQPLPALQKMIDEFKSKHFSRFVVGVQLREEFMEFLEWPREWLSCINKVVSLHKSKHLPLNETAVFLATDLQASQVQVHWPSLRVLSVPKIPGRSAKAQIYAALDVFLLAETQIQILTEHSTFGSSASGFSSSVPYAMTRHGDCRRYTNSQPHCHFCQYVTRLSCFDPQTWYSPVNSIEP